MNLVQKLGLVTLSPSVAQSTTDSPEIFHEWDKVIDGTKRNGSPARIVYCCTNRDSSSA
jgi:hypothetical protein